MCRDSLKFHNVYLCWNIIACGVLLGVHNVVVMVGYSPDFFLVVCMVGVSQNVVYCLKSGFPNVLNHFQFHNLVIVDKKMYYVGTSIVVGAVYLVTGVVLLVGSL